jgi:hypothetical protein
VQTTTRRTFLVNAAATALVPLLASSGLAQHNDSRDAVSVFDYLTDAEKADVRAGALSINVRASVAKALRASRHVYFPEGSYYLGDVAKSARIFDVNGGGGSLSILSEGRVRLVCNTTDYSIPQFFYVAHARGVRIGTFHFRDAGYDNNGRPGSKWRGAAGVVLAATGRGTQTVKNVEIDALYCTSMVQAFVCTGNYPDARIENIRIRKIHADTCYYGVNCQNNGDDVEIEELRTRNVKRSYFVYGVTGHKVKVYSSENQNSTGDINISCNGLRTADLDIYYACSTPRNVVTLININTFGEAVGKIENIKLKLDIESLTRAEVVSFQTYTDPAAPPIRENRGPTSNIYDNIKITGGIRAHEAPTHLDIRSQPRIRGKMWLGKEISAARITSNVRAYFDLSTLNED